MLIIKVGGSIFAPKDNNVFDIKYLTKLKNKLEKIYKGQIILIHGTGNIGHGFVNKYGINKETFKKYLDLRNNFYNNMEYIFLGYKRIYGEDLIKRGEQLIFKYKNIISGGDASSKNYNIISSDDIFGSLIKSKIEKNTIILTDVDGVFDIKGKIIPFLNLSNIDNIKFWKKKGDVTNGMKGKLLALKKYIPKDSKGIWICNGFDLSNFENILKTGKGKGTLVNI